MKAKVPVIIKGVDGAESIYALAALNQKDKSKYVTVKLAPRTASSDISQMHFRIKVYGEIATKDLYLSNGSGEYMSGTITGTEFVDFMVSLERQGFDCVTPEAVMKVMGRRSAIKGIDLTGPRWSMDLSKLTSAKVAEYKRKGTIV